MLQCVLQCGVAVWCCSVVLQCVVAVALRVVFIVAGCCCCCSVLRLLRLCRFSRWRADLLLQCVVAVCCCNGYVLECGSFVLLQCVAMLHVLQ